jgi:hypothetical protein
MAEITLDSLEQQLALATQWGTATLSGTKLRAS